MQDESTPIQKKNEQAISVRTKRLLERLEELWQCSDELTFEAVRRILVDLPEEDQAVGIEALADHLFNLMKLHFLNIVATFHKKAKEEGISAEERDEIAHDIRQESFQIMQSLEKQLAIRSVDDLVMLGNITFGLYSMSLVESAEQAERWMYKLPKMYRDRLEHEHLVLEPPQVTVIVSATSTKPTTSWNVVLSQPSIAWTGNYQPQQIVPVSSLIKAAQESGYRANVGVVSFDSDKIVKRRLNRLQLSIRHLLSAKSIKVYGLESVELLHNDPFDKEGR